MSDLNFGASASVFINAGQIVRVSTSGVATVVMQYGGPEGTTTITASTKDFGPYGVPAKIRITATSGLVTYRDLDESITFTPDESLAVKALVSGEGIVRVIGQSAVPIVHTGTTAATLLATVPVPANVMGPNGALRFTVWWSMTNNANSKNVTLRWGNGNITIWSAGIASWPAACGQVMVCNRGNAGSQLLSATGSTASFGQLAGFATASDDTTIDQRVQITCTLANAADTVTIERYLVEVLR